MGKPRGPVQVQARPQGGMRPMAGQPIAMLPLKIRGMCWHCGALDHYANVCPRREYLLGYGSHLLCGNCGQEGHTTVVCREPMRMKEQPRYVRAPPKDQIALNWSNKAVAEGPAWTEAVAPS